MTVASTTAQTGPYFPNGVTTSFAFDFEVAAADELQVVAVVDDVETTVSSALYSVSLSNDGTGTVTFDTAPTAAVYPEIYIRSNPDFGQNIEITNSGAFLQQVVEQGFDRSAIRDIYLKAKLTTALASLAALEAVAFDPSLAQLAENVGYVASGSSSAISVAKALDAFVTPQMMGGPNVGTGDVDIDTAAFIAALDECENTGAVLAVPGLRGNVYKLHADTNFARAKIQIVGWGNPVLEFVGTGRAFVLDTEGANGEFIEDIRVENLTIVGSPTITDGFYSRGMVRSVFRNIEVKEVSRYAFHILHGVSSTYDSLKYSPAGQTTKATRGLLISNNGTGYYTADCTFINCVSEDFAGTGCYVEDGSGNIFLGGTFEGVTTGLVVGTTSRRNSFKSVWFEANSNKDIEDTGVLSSYSDCYFGSNAPTNPNVIVSTGQGATFQGGYIRTAQLQSTSRDTLFIGVGFDQNLSGTLGITGTGTFRSLGCLKINDSGAVVGRMPDVLGTGDSVTLIGKAASDTAVAGSEFGTDGGSSHTSSSAYQLFNKIGGGTIIQEYRSTGTAVGSITTNGSSTSFNTSSARALKIDDGPVADPIALLMAVEPRMARFESAPDEPSCPMFFADELAAVNPWSATEDSADYGKQTAILWAVCRHQQGVIEALTARLDAAGL